MAVADHGKFARIMLALPITKQSEVLEQLAGNRKSSGRAPSSRPPLSSTGMRSQAQGKAAGTPRRLVRFIRQLRRTYDPPAMTADQLVGALPREFERWKQSIRPSAKAVAQDDARQSADMACERSAASRQCITPGMAEGLKRRRAPQRKTANQRYGPKRQCSTVRAAQG
jgi:hypothetical protein